MWKEYYVATSVEDALQTLAEWEGRARLIAGGTDLAIDINEGKYAPDCLVDTTRIPGLDLIEEDD